MGHILRTGNNIFLNASRVAFYTVTLLLILIFHAIVTLVLFFM